MFFSISPLFRISLFSTLSVLILLYAGCTPKAARTRTDREVHSLIRSAARGVSPEVQRYRFEPDAQSRHHDPFDPDCEPMPPDDPVAHQFMHCVRGKKLCSCGKCARTNWTENPFWREYLGLAEGEQIALDQDKALDLALLHSPTFQFAVEDLYQSALAVSNQRFRFDVQFFGGNSLLYDVEGRIRQDPNSASVSQLTHDSQFGFSRNFAAGGELLVGVANSLTWQLAGADQFNSTTLLNLNFVQPLLRGAGKKIVLENLLQSERDLLGSIRYLDYYRQCFYLTLVSGYRVAPRRNFSPLVRDVIEPFFDVSLGESNTSINGYYGLLLAQARIDNQEQYLRRIAGMQHQIEIYNKDGILDNLSVQEGRTRLYEAWSTLLMQKHRYAHDKDRFLVNTLGLPPEVPVVVRDPCQDHFHFTDDTVEELQKNAIMMLLIFQSRDCPIQERGMAYFDRGVGRLDAAVQSTDLEFESLQQQLPERLEYLRNLEAGAGMRYIDDDSSNEVRKPDFNGTGFFQHILVDTSENLTKIRQQYESLTLLTDHLHKTSRKELFEQARSNSLPAPVREAMIRLQMEALLDTAECTRHLPGSYAHPNDPEIPDFQERGDMLFMDRLDLPKGFEFAFEPIPERPADHIIEPEEVYFRHWINRLLYRIAMQATEISICQMTVRLYSISLTPPEIEPYEAMKIAAENRLDWHNAKADLIDSWRQIELAANRLKSDLSVELSAGSGRLESGGPLFDAENSHLNVGLRWDGPLNRHQERNNYRQSQLDYQQARRLYTSYVDRVDTKIRETIRALEKCRIDFEIKRANIIAAKLAVVHAQRELIHPLILGDDTPIEPSLTLRVINAHQGYLRAKNEIIEIWVRYELLRRMLDFQTGTMAFDSAGRWVDPQRHVAAPVLAPHVK